jgi:hypothetical protein
MQVRARQDLKNVQVCTCMAISVADHGSSLCYTVPLHAANLPHEIYHKALLFGILVCFLLGIPILFKMAALRYQTVDQIVSLLLMS